MRAIEAVTTPGETTALCQSVGVSRASLYRRRCPASRSTPRPPRAPSPRALGAPERQVVLDVLHSERFVDQSPAEVHATLLEEQTYQCSPRTMYRVLAAADEVRERRAQARHPVYTKPELVATGPNQVWSWDITKLKGPIPCLYYSLYVILDLFSRYVVGWLVARHENAHLAERLIAATCLKQDIAPQQLTIHADRGAPMRSKLVALLFSDRSGHRRQSFAAAREQRQSVLRSAVPDPEVPTRVSRPVRLAQTRARRQPRSVRVVQQRAPSQRAQLSHAGRRPLRPRRDRPRGPAPHTPGRIRCPSRAVRPGATTSSNAANGRVDQSPAETDPRGCPRSDERHPGRPTAWGDPPGTTHQ